MGTNPGRMRLTNPTKKAAARRHRCIFDIESTQRRPLAKDSQKKSCGAKVHCADSSNSFIQLLPLSTSRGRVPSGGPTMPSFSMMSIKWAARP